MTHAAPPSLTPGDTGDGFWRDLFAHTSATVRLAGPVIVARLGLLGLTAVDVLVLGRVSEHELARYTLGTTPFDGLVAMLVGLLLGASVLVAKANGAGDQTEVGPIWQRGLLYGLVIGTGLAVLLQFSEPFFHAVGQSAELAIGAAEVTRILGLTMVPYALFLTNQMVLEALHRPTPGMVAMVMANLANLILNPILAFGWFGLPALGAEGVAIGTVMIASGLALATTLYVLLHPQHRDLGVRARVSRPWRSAVAQRRIGYASGASYGLEASSFSILTLMVGLLGPLALAAHGVTFQFIALTFMIAFGIAAATQVRVGTAWGRGAHRDVALAGWVGLVLAMVFVGVFSAIYAITPLPLVRIFTDDPVIIAAALPVMPWAALLLVFDGGQSVMNHACRGRGDTWFPTALHFGSYFLVMIPAGWVLAHTLGFGLVGIYQGIALASVVSVVALAARFAVLTRRR